MITTFRIMTPTCFLAKIAQILQKVFVCFSGKGRGDKILILTYLDSPVAKVFPRYCLLLSISAIFKGKRERGRVKVRIKVRILQNFFKQCFCLLEYLPMVTILAILDHTWESRGQKTSQIGLFCGC